MTHHLMGVPEIAERLGITRQRVHQLMTTYEDFPAPAARLRMGAVWHTADIEAWLAAHPERKPGRPRQA